jgi:hypothetical protein
MTIKYTTIFHSKALQNLPKIGIFGLQIHHLATLDWTEKKMAPLNEWNADSNQRDNLFSFAAMQGDQMSSQKMTQNVAQPNFSLN